MKSYLSFIFVALISTNVLPAEAEKPLFDWGVLAGHGGLADYPASDEYRYRTIPAPYLNYRGDILRSDEQDGTRLRFLRDDKFDFDLSFSGSFPTETDNNQARFNMPNLDWTLEVGPRLLYYFYKNKSGNMRIGLPLRTGFATDFNTWSQLGYVFAPTFQIDMLDVGTPNLNFYFLFNLNYLSERHADYFFQIDPQYQTAQRSAFDAKGGFMSHDTSLAVKYEWNKKILILAAEYSDYTQSENRFSYLHRTSVNWSYLVAFGWLLFETDEKAFD